MLTQNLRNSDDWNKHHVLLIRLTKLHRTVERTLVNRTKSHLPWIWLHFSAIVTRLTRTPGDNSNSPLTWTKFRFSWSKCTPITRILVLATRHGCPLKYPINSSCRGFNKCSEQFTYLIVISPSYESYTNWQNCFIIRMYNRVIVSDEISLICTVLYTEVLKNQ